MKSGQTFHHIFYQHTNAAKPWAIEVGAYLTPNGIFHDIQVTVYCELMETLTLSFETSREYNLSGMIAYAWNRLEACARRNNKMKPAKGSDFRYFSLEFNDEYDKVMFGEG